jgi:hypothetical protein
MADDRQVAMTKLAESCEDATVIDFLLYGLDRDGTLQGSEVWAGITRSEAERMACDRLKTYEVVELWEGSIRVLTLGRDTHPPD